MSFSPAAAVAADKRPITIRRPRSRGWEPAGNVRELAQYADLFRTLTEHRIRVRYKQSVLGFGWAVLQPVSMMLIFTLVFSRIAHVPTEGIPYALFVFSAQAFLPSLHGALDQRAQSSSRIRMFL